jgi:C-terminal processing protease CtpA/Prc
MRAYLAASTCLLIAGLARAQTNAPEASAEATEYLVTALDHIEKGSRVYATDWKAMRAKALTTIAKAGARTTADTYPAIREALATLGDKHGLLLDPTAAKLFNPGRATKGTGLLVVPPDAIVAQVAPGSPAAAAGLALGDRIVAVEGLAGLAELPRREFERLFKSGQRPDGSTAPLALRVRAGSAEPRALEVPLAQFDEHQAPIGLRLDGGIAYLELPGVSSGPKAATYDDAVHELLGEFDDGSLRGFIVDLRRNTGGTLWPMLAGIGPLAGAGEVGAFVSAHGSADWSYDAELGAAKSGTYELAKVAEPYPLRDDLPVAVLAGPLTAGFGEALVVAFAGRARTRRFGEGTSGLPTSNTQIPLADGALLVLTVTVHADRTGTRYDDVIAPDETVATDWARFGTAEDPVIVAACRWLASAADAK